MERLGAALVGFGMAGRVFHAPLIRAVPGLELRAIVQRRGDEARERYPEVTIARELESVLNDRRIGLIVVATPTVSHFEIARRALLADKHVVVDKPVTVTSSEADELIEIARERKRILTVFHNRRWDGDFLTVRGLLAALTLGRMVEYESRFNRFRNEPRDGAWRESADPGSGVLYDLGSHLIDQALVLFGLPDSVTADVRTERDFGEADDAFDIRMHYGASRVTLAANMLRRERSPRFLLRGTEATFIKYGLDTQEAALSARQTPRTEGWGLDPEESWGTLLGDTGEQQIETRAGNYPAFYENVLDAIHGETKLDVRPEDARNAIWIIEMALESSRNATSVRMSPRYRSPSSDRSIP